MRDERGTVAAEAALVLPTLVLVTVALCWLVGLGVAQARVVDAAREAARVVARGESSGTAAGLAQQVAPPGARVSIKAGQERVVVDVTARLRPPGGLLGGLVGAVVRGHAVAATEPGAGSGAVAGWAP